MSKYIILLLLISGCSTMELKEETPKDRWEDCEWLIDLNPDLWRHCLCPECLP